MESAISPYLVQSVGSPCSVAGGHLHLILRRAQLLQARSFLAFAMNSGLLPSSSGETFVIFKPMEQQLWRVLCEFGAQNGISQAMAKSQKCRG